MGILDGTFDDPNQMSMLGLAAGIANAARPSRLPVPFGAAMAEGLQGAMQFRGQAQQQQLLQQEIQQRGFANMQTLMQMQMLNNEALRRGRPAPYGDLSGVAKQFGVPWQGAGAPQGGSILAGNAGPPPAMQGMLSGGAPQVAGAPQMAQASPIAAQPQMPAGGASQEPYDAFDVGMTARTLGAEAAKWEAAQHPPPLEIERQIRAMGIDPQSTQGKMLLQQDYLNKTNDPNYKGKQAAAEAWAKVAPALRQAGGEAQIKANFAISPRTVITDDGPQTVPMTDAQALQIAGAGPGGFGEHKVTFAPEPSPMNKPIIDSQIKEQIEPTRKAFYDNQKLQYAVKAIGALSEGTSTGTFTPHIADLNNALRQLGMPQVSGSSLDAGKVATLNKELNDMLVGRIQAATAEGGASVRMNRSLMQIIQASKPTLETPGPALRGIANNMLDVIGEEQAHHKALLDEATSKISKAQPLPSNWESNYWEKHPSKADAIAQKYASAVSTQPTPSTPTPLAGKSDNRPMQPLPSLKDRVPGKTTWTAPSGKVHTWLGNGWSD